MTERIRLDAFTTREEVEGDFVGRSELRQRIVSAAEEGDVSLVAQLQQEHRARRLAARGVQIVRAPVVGSWVLRTTTSAVSLDGYRGDALVDGFLLTWGPRPTSMGNGKVVPMDVQAGALARWLREVDPITVPLLVDHVEHGSPCGRFVSFQITSEGLRATCAINSTHGGAEELLGAADDGRAWFSAHFRIQRSHLGGKLKSGERVHIADEVAIVEGSLTGRPADGGAIILAVRGKPTRFRLEQEATARDAELRRLFGLS